MLIGLLVILVATWSSRSPTRRASRGHGRAPSAISCCCSAASRSLPRCLGYIGLARFISQQIVWTGAVLATMYIGFLSSRAVSEEGAFAGTAIGSARPALASASTRAALDQFSLLLSIVINVLVVVAGLPLILFQWGFQPGDISAWAYKIATGISIGSFTFSLTGILWGLLVFGRRLLR